MSVRVVSVLDTRISVTVVSFGGVSVVVDVFVTETMPAAFVEVPEKEMVSVIGWALSDEDDGFTKVVADGISDDANDSVTVVGSVVTVETEPGADGVNDVLLTVVEDDPVKELAFKFVLVDERYSKVAASEDEGLDVEEIVLGVADCFDSVKPDVTGSLVCFNILGVTVVSIVFDGNTDCVDSILMTSFVDSWLGVSVAASVSVERLLYLEDSMDCVVMSFVYILVIVKGFVDSFGRDFLSVELCELVWSVYVVPVDKTCMV